MSTPKSSVFDITEDYYYYAKKVILWVEEKMKTYTITPKGQVTIPAEIREKLKVYPGDKIIYEDTASGILMKSAKMDMITDFGFLKGRKDSADLDKIRTSVREKIAKRIHRK